MKKFISAICVIALMMPSTLSAFADAGTADNLSGQQAVVVDVADSTEDAAETETETVVETESASVVSTEKASDTKATSDTSKASETETMDETEDEPEVDPQYADDPQYWKEMKKQYGVATMSAVPSGYIHDSRFNKGYKIHYGVDVSSFQPNIDWAKAKADGVEFAIIRAGYRGWGTGRIVADEDIIKNIKGAKAQGIKVGVYIFSQAITEKEAREEVDKTIEFIGGQKIDLPMVLDYEYAESYNQLTGRLYKANLSRQAATNVCLAFCEYASQKGYEPMVYANKDMLTNKLDADAISSKYSIWLANYTTQTSYSGDYDFWQYSIVPVDGISDSTDGDFWYEKVTNDISIRNSNKPGNINQGASFSIRGQLLSTAEMSSVTVGVYDIDGKQVIGKTVNPNSKEYDIADIDSSIEFSKLPVGAYRYKIMATAGQTKTLVNSAFMVLSNGRTVADGTYYIESMKNNGYGLNTSGNSNASGANVVLGAKSSSNYMKYVFSYQSNGYYKIKNAASGQYLGVTGQKSASGSNVEQASGGTRWKVIPDGKGSYYLVPECSGTAALDLANGTVANGTNIRIWNYNLTEGQRWKLESTTTSTAAPKISGQTKPATMKAGSSFSIRGTVTSDLPLTEVTVGVYDTSGNLKTGKTVRPNTTSYDLRNVDTSIKFGSLGTGGYRYKVTAKTSAGTTTLVNSAFMVLGSGRTVADGTYYIESMKNNGYGLNTSGNSNVSGANVVLGAKSSSNYMKYVFSYQSNGYYKIKNAASGQYLGVTGQKSASGSNVEQASGGTRWKVIPDGKGSYYLVPECSGTAALDLANGTVANGTNIRIWNYNLTEGQRWKLESTTTSTAAPKISGQTKPATMKAGSSFSIRGTVTSDLPLTEVTVGVYDTSGNLKTGKTVRPNTTSYDLRNVDTSIKFGSLTTGGYRYKVTAKTSAGTATLVNSAFMVLGSGRTVADGTYYIESMKNNGYGLNTSGNSNASGANVVLGAKSSSNYMKYVFSYQSNGYYKIKNVGSGKYLGVTGQKSASGSNVEQASGGTRWQVIPDGKGSYYLVPECSNTAAVDLTNGTVANGTNIRIWNYNLTEGQRWKLESTTTSTVAPKISGQTKPSTMKAGSSFSIRGTITSGQKLTEVTVGVYDTSGSMKIGKTVRPNTTSYDLRNVDTSIKFGSLGTGGYRYKVTAKTSAGTTTLVNSAFMVLGRGRTVANGTYYIESMKNNGYGLNVSGNSSASGANVVLGAKSSSNYMKYVFTYQGNGYYKIKNVGSGKYLGVTGQKSASGSNVEQASGGTRWQVIPDGKGSYYLVPECSNTAAVDLTNGTVANGTNIRIWNYNLTEGQRWSLVK